MATGVVETGATRSRSTEKFQGTVGVVDDRGDVHTRHTADGDADRIDGDAGGCCADGDSAWNQAYRIAAIQIDEFDFVGAGFGDGSDSQTRHRRRWRWESRLRSKEAVADSAQGDWSLRSLERTARLVTAVVGEATLLVTLTGNRPAVGSGGMVSENLTRRGLRDREWECR